MFERAFDSCPAPDAERVERLLAALPPALGTLLRAELDAGNAVIAIESGFPAPPAGVRVMLARKVGSVDAGDSAAIEALGLQRRAWPAALREMGWSDARGHCWLLEPATSDDVAAAPRPPVDARATHGMQHPEPPASAGLAADAPTPDEAFRHVGAERITGSEALRAWDASRVLDYERWREGVGYDLDALQRMSADERASVETSLLHGLEGWRDVQALAALDTPRARAALLRTLCEGDPALRVAVLRHAPKVAAEAGEAAVVEALVAAVESAEFFDGLTEALYEIEDVHPPAVIDALWRGLADRPGPIAVHLAARLAYLHGLSREPFDWSLRPFFLSFHSEDPVQRAAAIAELRRRIDGAGPSAAS